MKKARKAGAPPLDPVTRMRASHDGDKSPDPITLLGGKAGGMRDEPTKRVPPALPPN
jgi:hypothetical protein